MSWAKPIGLVSFLVLLPLAAYPTLMPVLQYTASQETRIHIFYISGQVVPAPETRTREVSPAGEPLVVERGRLVILGFTATISSLPDMHVQIWLNIHGQRYFFVNSGHLGTANLAMTGLYIIIPPNEEVTAGWWAHNMSNERRDFHGSVTVVYMILG